jgi:hypothetical protein
MTKFVTPKGVAVWPHLNTPDTKFVTEGEYHTKLRLSADEAQPLVRQLEAIRKTYLEEAIRKDPKVKQYKMADLYEEEVDDQGDLTGNYLFKFKQKAVINTRAGTTLNMKVALFNSRVEPSDAVIGGGSEIKIAATAVGYAMPSTKMVGLSLRPTAVQIISLSSGTTTGGAQAFSVEDGYVDPPKENLDDDEVPSFDDDEADF